jgi:2-succinyl-5-enolpyruvyl-6-hydroxy-3-cyclohexene-1-carboxylate synthase
VVNDFDDGDVIRFEGRVFLELAARLPADSLLFVGNSMPVRDMDTFFPKLGRSVRVLANRGASGIDGVISTALGAAAAWAGRTVLVIGDVSFYHDFTSLLNAARHGIDLAVVLIHNDGGGIFQFLPQAGYPDTFDQFRTPHGLDFEAGVRMFGGVFRRARTWHEFGAELEAGLERPGLTVLEVRTDPNENRALHGDVLQRIADAVRRLEGPW